MKELREKVGESTSGRNSHPTTPSQYVTHVELEEFRYASKPGIQEAIKAAAENQVANSPPPIIDAQAPKGTDIMSTVSGGVHADDNSRSIDTDGDHDGADRQSLMR